MQFIEHLTTSQVFACLVGTYQNSPMEKIDEKRETRRARLKEWFAHRTIPSEEKSYLSQLMSGKAPFGEKAARRLEETYRMDSGYLDSPLGAPIVQPHILMTNISPYVTDRRAVPVISLVRASELADINCDLEPGEGDRFEIPDYKVGPRAWAHVVSGSSMDDGTERGVPDGWIIFCDPDLAPSPNAFVIAKQTANQQATFKQLVFEDDKWFLRPLNRQFTAIPIDRRDLIVIAVVTEARPPSRKLS